MNSREYCVYIHTTPSNKVYIGITCMEPNKRWKNGKGYELCTAFKRAIDKYGWDNIKHEILERGLTKDEACQKEKQYISQYKSTEPEHGYNLTSGGEHYEPNAEWRERLSRSLKKSFAERPEFREHLSEIQKGKKMSDESTEKKRAAMLQFYENHPEKKLLCGNSFRGKNRGEEFARKLGERKSKRIKCIETQEVFKSVVNASEVLGVSRTGISNVLHGRAKTCGGYTFECV